MAMVDTSQTALLQSKLRNLGHGKRSKGRYMSLRNLTPAERKIWRRMQKRQHNDTRVRLGDQQERWGMLKEALGLRRDSEVAQILLSNFDRLQASEEREGIEVVAGSAEQHSLVQTEVDSKVRRKEESHVTAQSTSGRSGVNLEYVQDGDVVYMYPPTPSQQDQGDFSDEESEEDDASSFLQLLEEINECHPDCGVHDATLKDIFDMRDSSHHSTSHQDDMDHSPTVDVKTLAAENTYLGYTSSLQQLVGEIPVEPCPEDQCGWVPLPVMKTIGTALTVRWVCKNGHVSKTWSSQPKIRENYAGDVALSSAIVLSGSSLPKVKMLCHCLNLGTCSEALHESLQVGCTFPAVRSYWEKVQKSVLADRLDKDITIAAGTKNDTHNQPSMFSPFISMDYTTGDILNVSTIDNRNTQQDSGTSELEAFTQTMDLVKNSNITVREVVTDPQQDLQDYMSQHPSVLHSFDVWNGAKDVGRKLAMASQRSEFYRPLERWIGEVTKHFMFCSQQAAGERMAFIAHWRGILHHVIGKHQWILGDRYGPAKCLHDPISQEVELEEDRLLQPGSLSHSALGEIVLNRPLLYNLDYYSRNRHMSCLERFWPYLDAYVNANDMHSHTACQTRFLLAAIDFQMHKDRSQQMRNGSPVFTRQYNRTTKRSVKVPVYEKKSYSYIWELMQEILMKSLVKDEAGV